MTGGISMHDLARAFENTRRARIEALEHEALEPRSSALWGHGPQCVPCALLRAAAGESTTQDLLMKDATGRPLIDQRFLG